MHLNIELKKVSKFKSDHSVKVKMIFPTENSNSKIFWKQINFLNILRLDFSSSYKIVQSWNIRIRLINTLAVFGKGFDQILEFLKQILSNNYRNLTSLSTSGGASASFG